VECALEIVVKYCGGCNCQIDRSKIISDVEVALPEGDRFTTDTANSPFGMGLLICGCMSACAWRPEMTVWAKRWVVVAGKTVDSREMPEDQIAAAILGKIEA
jgi:hypothetical protein